AKENLISRRETHLDQLADKLREERVRRVVEPILAGSLVPDSVPWDDVEYVIDLGLIVRNPDGYGVANPIYREVLPREVTAITAMNLQAQVNPAWYIGADGRLEVGKLLAGFQEFYRENAEAWLAGYSYREAGPQLLLQAYLQRVANGGGRIEREYALGRRRTDLLVIWPLGPDLRQKAVIELKVLHKGLEETVRQGLAQTWDYADRSGVDEAHLVVFDRRPERPWSEKIFCRQESFQGRVITVWGM
ncbi:MAG: ATP-binding protein, partial [Thermodesulfobacteriota bacterium]